MMKFQKLNKISYITYRTKILELYLDAFTKGKYAQYISEDKAQKTLDELMKKSDGMIVVEDQQLVAALIAFPFVLENDFPKQMQDELTLEKTIYIADVMVNADFRGKGVGKKLITKYLNEVDANYSDVVIRVWDKNIPALNLYRKLGFQDKAKIKQTKFKKEDGMPFEMDKIYLTKKL